MPKQPKISHDSSDSGSETPETVQLGAAKNSVLERERAVKDFHTSCGATHLNYCAASQIIRIRAAKRRKELNKAREAARKTAANERRRKLGTSQLHTRTTSSSISSNDENEEFVDESAIDLRSQQRMAQAMQDAEMEGAGGFGSSASGTSASEAESEASEDDLSSSSNNSDGAEKRGQDDRGHGHARRHLPPSKPDPPSSSHASSAANYLPNAVFARAKADIDTHKAKLNSIEELRQRRAAERAKKYGKKTKSSASSKLSPKEMVVGLVAFFSAV
jgi:hypothetical protein